MRSENLAAEIRVSNKDPAYFPFLDVLRGLAASWVVMFHLIYITTPNMAPPRLLDRLMKSGGMGVTLFFVVSAFSLCLSSERNKNDRVWVFYLRRFFRIAPLFYAALALTLFRDQSVFGVKHDYAQIVSSLFFIFNFVNGWQEGIVWASWTIGIEMVFYVLFPYIWKVNLTPPAVIFRVASLCCASIVAYSVINAFPSGGQFWQWSFFKHLPSFLIGILVYEAWKRLSRQPETDANKYTGSAIFSCGLLLGIALLYSDQPFPLLAGLYWQGIICALLVLGAGLGAAHKFFSSPMLCRIGRNSYSIYLLHPLVIVVLQPVYKKIADVIHSPSTSFLISAAITLFAIYLLAELSWRFVERPGLNMGAKIIRNLRSLFGQSQIKFD